MRGGNDPRNLKSDSKGNNKVMRLEFLRGFQQGEEEKMVICQEFSMSGL